MRRKLVKNRSWRIFLCFLTIFFVVQTFGQPISREKIEEANRLYEEAEKLNENEEQDSLQKALSKYQTASRIFKENGAKSGEARSLFQAGFILRKFGKFAEALKSFETALGIFQKTGEEIWEGRAFNAVGIVYSDLNEKQKALIFYTNAIYVFKKIDDFDEVVPVFNNMGKVYLDLGKSKEALFYFELALPYLELNQDEFAVGATLNNIGTVYYQEGKYQKSLEYHEKSLKIAKEIEVKELELSALMNVGTAYFKLGNPKKAVEVLNEALQMTRAAGNNKDEAHVLTCLMIAWKELKNPQIAILFGKQSVNKYQEIRQSIQFLREDTQKNFLGSVENIYRELADLLIEQGELAQANQVLRMLKEAEYYDFVRRDAGEIKSLGLKVLLNESEKSLIASYTLLADRISEIGSEFYKLDEKKRRLSRQEKTLSPNEQAEYEKLVNQLSVANAAFKLFLEKTLVTELGKEKAKNVDYDRNLQAKLKKWGNGTVVLYTALTPTRYRVILTTPTLQIDGKSEIKSAELNKKIFEFRKSLRDIKTDPRVLGKELYDILIKPLEKHLQASGAKTLVWSLDGALRYIPLAALSPDGKTYLTEKYQNVIITPKTRDDLTDTDTEWQALGVGVSESQTVVNPENAQEKLYFVPLPGTRDELTAIIRDEQLPNEKGILKGKRFIDNEFTFKNLANSLAQETAAGRKKFTAVHIASHFQLGNTWTNSFLLLGGGQILTLEQLSNSPEIDFEDVELVTLSACDTAISENSTGKEIDSLAEAIQTKSGKSILATLWSVADVSTPLLMTEFYRLRQQNPQLTKAEIISQVQVSMINGTIKPRNEIIELLEKELQKNNQDTTKTNKFVFDKNKPFAHPYFWSPFVLIGNWR